MTYSLLLGLAGGLVGAAVWAAIVFRSGRHYPRMAIGVGLLVGIGVRYGVVGAPQTIHGMLAVVTAIFCILTGKYAVAHWMAARLNLVLVDISDDFMISCQADRIAKRREAQGQILDWPEERGLPSVPFAWRYPADVWAEAQGQWRRMSPIEREAKVEEHRREMREPLDGAIANLRRIGFRGGFRLLNLIWIALGALFAFMIASGRDSFFQ